MFYFLTHVELSRSMATILEMPQYIKVKVISVRRLKSANRLIWNQKI